jgi:hypothetical protein
MRKARIFWFVLTITIGLLIGLFLGWKYFPVSYQEMTFSSLRSDYKADYVLMVAEVFHQDNNLAGAVNRLETLGAGSALRTTQQAVLTGRELDYTADDIELLVRLIEALQAAPADAAPGDTP